MTALSARRAALAAATALTLASAPLHAQEQQSWTSSSSSFSPEFTAGAAGQFYDVRSPTGETILERRRLTGTLGVGGYNLLAPPPGDVKAPEILFRARVRYDADYGASGATTDPTQLGSLVPGFDQQLVDIMYAYAEGRRFLGGLLGFKLGRQYVTDVLGWWSFDGGQVSVTTPYYVKAEVYGGVEQRGGIPLSSSRWQADGIWTGGRSSQYGGSVYPAFQPAAVAPAIGVALDSTGVSWIHGRLTYRRVYNTDASNLTEFQLGLYDHAQYNGWRVSSERLGYAVDATAGTIAGIKAGLVYDLYQDDFTSLYGSIDAYVSKAVTVSADYDYYVPWFDGDSIFNFFQAEPMNDVGLRANVDLDRHWSFSGGGHVRVYTVQTAENSTCPTCPSPYYSAATYYPTNGHPFDEGGNLAARWRTGETVVNLHGSGAFGDEGDRVGADVAAEHVFETRYVASGRIGVWQWDDKLRPDRDATSFNYVAGLGYRFAPRSQGGVEWEHDINRLVGQRFRLLFTLAVAVGK